MRQLELREVASSVETLRYGGFARTNVYDDLADGPVYASLNLPTFNSTYLETPLSPEGITAISAARGASASRR